MACTSAWYEGMFISLCAVLLLDLYILMVFHSTVPMENLFNARVKTTSTMGLLN